MLLNYPVQKIFRYALITSPLFGLFGATPGFTMEVVHLNRVAEIFIQITGFTLFLWVLNILLFHSGTWVALLRNNSVRFIISLLIAGLSAYFLFKFLHPVPGFHHKLVNDKLLPLNTPLTVNGPNGPQHLLPFRAKPFFPAFIILQPLATNVIIYILIELLVLKQTKEKVALENEQLKLANSEARNSQLKQQLHPHFLFNSLSTLRSLISRSQEQATDYLERLSELLRFSTNNSNKPVVTLKAEVELCRNYLEMQQVRFGQALQFTINIPDTLQVKSWIPTFALQSLAENAIKHNILTNEQPLHIDIKAVENNTYIIIKNNLQPRPAGIHSSGVGLANLEERYRLLSGDPVLIKNDSGYYEVKIKLLEDAGNYH
ncbi:MAG TPA: histidine kinase [Ferruginibacter sp.]|nr:histidine kinase [Ferruginibacter sp.]HMP21517.1 histidine kinase [Ferruginibacter sp.]